MGLDAVVYCDCFEKGRLRELPPPGCHLAIARDGSLSCGSEELEIQLAFDQWQVDRACEHELGVLLHKRIGNIALVSALREELERLPDRFPVILSRVLYNGTHCGDFLSLELVEQVSIELQRLLEFRCTDSTRSVFMQEFAAQMTELVDSALRIGKPIAF